MTRPCAQGHNIYTLRRTTATMTRPCAQAHAISTLHRTAVVTRHRVLRQHQIRQYRDLDAANADSVACAINKEQRRSSASALSPKVAPRSAASRQQRSLARVVSANTAEQSADSQ
jgi:hypothetical protein